jgi:hypothetical protein
VPSFFYVDHDTFTGKYIGPTGPLLNSGDIARGDYVRLLAKIEDDEDRFLSQNKIIVALTAGGMSEAMKIAKLVKALHSEVGVRPLTGNCVGACFLIYVAASERSRVREIPPLSTPGVGCSTSAANRPMP